MLKMKIWLQYVCPFQMPIETDEVGIGLITSYLREHGYTVRLSMTRIADLDYQEIYNFAPDLIGFTLYDKNKATTFKVIREIKKYLPQTYICVGGVCASIQQERLLLENKDIDFVVKGEGELTTKELLDCICENKPLNDVQGLIYRSNDNKICNNANRPLIQDLDAMPDVARDILTDNQLKIAHVFTSRGCLAQCGFCSKEIFWSGWRGRSIERTVDEIEQIAQRHSILFYNIIDASFEDPYVDCSRTLAIADEIIKRDLNILYFADFRAEVWRKLSHDDIVKLKKSGLSALCIGVEAGNDEDLAFYNKIARTEDNHKSMQLFASYGINISPGFINFNPESTIERLLKNIDFLREYDMAIKFMTKLDVYEGTCIYEKIKAKQLIKEDSGTIVYRFEDERTDRFSTYFFALCDAINKACNGVFHIMDFFHDYYMTLLTFYKRLAENKKDIELAHGIEAFAMWFSNKRKQDSAQLAESFIYLLESFDLSCTYEEFESAFFHKTSIDMLSEMGEQYQKRHRKLQYYIAKNYPEHLIF